MFKTMTIDDVVRSLVGEIRPVGETNTDEQRFENLKEMTGLVDVLLAEIREVAADRDRPEFSIRRAGKRAAAWLDEVRNQ